jgi:hypothetical protein
MAYRKTVIQTAATGATDLQLTLYFAGAQARLSGQVNGTSESYDVAVLDVMSAPDATSLRTLLRNAHLAALVLRGYVDS